MLERYPDWQTTPSPAAVHGRIREWARRTPDAVAILSPSLESLTYGQLAAELHRFGETLALSGIGPSDRVAVALPSGMDQAIAVLAVMAHAACAPLDPGYPEPEYAFTLSRLRPKAILAPEGSPAISAARSLGIPILPGFPSRRIPAEAGPAAMNSGASEAGGGAPSLLLFTSGTTGHAKLVGLTSTQLAHAAGTIAETLALDDRDRCLGVMPLFHIHGLSTLLATLLSGGSYVCVPGFSSIGFFESIGRTRPTWYSASPAIHRAIVQAAPVERPLRTTLRFVRSASAPMPPSLASEIEETLGVPLVEAYGMTEAAPLVATNRLPPFARKSGSAGRAAGPEVAIVDADGGFLPAGEPGEIVIRGPNVIARYEDDPEPGDAFLGTWLRTGDTGHLDAEGYLFVTGRAKDIINRGGEKIAPGWVEEALLEHPSIAEAVVFGVADPVLGEAVAAAIVLAPHATGTDETQSIRDFVAARRARFAVPQQIVVVDRLPVGLDGKIRRKEFAALLGLGEGRGATRDRRVPPVTPTQRLVAATFGDVLRLPPPGLTADFFELGGNSLSAMQVIARLQAALGVELPVGLLFDHPTVQRAADHVAGAIADLVASGARTLGPAGAPAEPLPSPRGAQQAPAPLSPQQRQLFFLDRMGSGSAYNMSASLSLTGPLDEVALARALDEIRRRHEPLRTRFLLRADEPVQIVDAPASRPELEIIDLGDLPDEARSAEAQRLAGEAASRPFDLENGPLFRPALVRLSEEESLLLLTIHHIVCDGWSIRIVHEELKQLYEAFRDGRPSPLPALASRYTDYVDAQGRSDLTHEAAYWTARLSNAPPECTFPLDRPRSRIRAYASDIVTAQVGQPLLQGLNALARNENATLFMVLLAAFQAILFRHNRQEDSVVGIPVANRQGRDFEPLVGFFANSLAMRTSLAGDPSFRSLLGRVRETTLGALAHQAMPLERVVADLKLARDPVRPPLFQVMFAYQGSEGSAGPPASSRSFTLAPGLAARPLQLRSGETKFDLTVYLSEAAGGLSLEWQFNRGLFDVESIRHIVRQYCLLLEGIAASPETKLSELRLLSPAEARRIEAGWAQGAVRARPPRNFLAAFEDHAHRAPDRLAVAGRGGDPMSYRRLAERANQLARYFRTLGAGENDLVGVCLPRSPDAVAVQLGIWKAGAAYLPLDPRYPAGRTAYAIADAGPRILVTTSQLLPAVRAALADDGEARPAAPRLVCLDEIGSEIAAMDTSSVDTRPAPEDLAYVIYTSGSTGRPKGAAITHGNVAHYAQALPSAIGIGPEDRYLHTASFSFSSSIRQMVAPLATGGMIVLATEDEVADPEALFTTIRDSGVTVVDLVPSYSAGCVEVLRSIEATTREDLLDNDLRLMLSASEPLPAALVTAWRTLLPPATRFINMFGQTETTGVVLTWEVPPDPGGGAIVPAGRPIPNTEAFILDGRQEIVPAGVCGALYIGGDGVGRGYINEPEAAGSSFAMLTVGGQDRRLFRTGDIVRYRHDGVIEFIGRADRQVKLRGFRVELGEVEQAIRGFAHVRECLVTAGAEGEAPGEGPLVAHVVYDGPPLDDPALALQLRAFLRQKLPHYMVPGRVVRIAALPRAPSGKLDLQASLETPAPVSTAQRAEEPSGPRPDLELAIRSITGIWMKVLRLERVGAGDNFFDLGGNSRLCINVMVEAKRLGLELTLNQIYRHQTIAELARAAIGHQAVETVTPVAASRPVDAPLLTADSLRAFGSEALIRAGLDPEGAAIVAEVQLEASLRGQQTHDMVSIPRYATRIAAGKINGNPKIRIERETPTAAAIDGDNGPGQWVSTVAMRTAIGKAREHGIGIVTARRSNHFGAAGQYVWEATKSGLIGLCTTNGPTVLAPTGGITPTFGNNPLAIGIPAGRHLPILLDIAMSVAPRSKIGLAVGQGAALPSGWILDGEGQPSTDLADLAAGLGVPIGGHKGYGLAMALEVLSGVMSGAGFGFAHRPDALHEQASADFGHLFVAIDPRLFLGAADFVDRVDRLIEQTKSGKRGSGVDEIFIPGERELLARERSLRDGVRLMPSTYRVLLDYGRRMGLSAQLMTAVAGVAE